MLLVWYDRFNFALRTGFAALFIAAFGMTSLAAVLQVGFWQFHHLWPVLGFCLIGVGLCALFDVRDILEIKGSLFRLLHAIAGRMAGVLCVGFGFVAFALALVAR